MIHCDYTIEELAPMHCRNKSFYGKAHVLRYEDGCIALMSYRTVVCEIDAKGNFHRTWDRYSATTMKHVHDFMVQNGLGGCGAERWRAFPVEEESHDSLWAARTVKFAATYY